MIVAGFGFRASATIDSLHDALARTGGTPHALATAADKAVAEPIRALAENLNLPLHPIDPERLQIQATATRSTAAQTHRATGSVAEAAALAAAGPGARLIAPRCISADRMATCALAETRETIP